MEGPSRLKQNHTEIWETNQDQKAASWVKVVRGRPAGGVFIPWGFQTCSYSLSHTGRLLVTSRGSQSMLGARIMVHQPCIQSVGLIGAVSVATCKRRPGGWLHVLWVIVTIYRQWSHTSDRETVRYQIWVIQKGLGSVAALNCALIITDQSTAEWV